MTDEDKVLARVLDEATAFLGGLDQRPVAPRADVDQVATALGGPLPAEGADPVQVIEELVAGAEPGLVAMPSGRFFGWVIGGALPAALAADWLTATWDQNAGLLVSSPAAAGAERVASAWLLDLLGLPPTAAVGFVTGAMMANFTCLAAARHEVLRRVGWDVDDQGLTDAPRVTVLAGEERHENVPYDCGLAVVADPPALYAAMGMHAAYLIQDARPDPFATVPEFSRRARGIPVWAALRSLGRRGVAELVERFCAHARRFADGLGAIEGVEVVNDVVFTQVVVSFGADEVTREVARRLLAEGTAWMTPSSWHGRAVLRISVSNWRTTEADVDRTLDAVRRVLHEVVG